MATRVNVDLGARSYGIEIAAGLLRQPGYLQSYLRSPEVLVVTNAQVAPLWLEPCLQAIGSDTVQALILPDGEQHKTLATLQQIFDTLMAKRYSRQVTLVALGGGVIGDIVGFAAACYLRGVACLQIPTTLLAQVDSSVGGKTAVNHPLGKNMIGAFHQPVAVIIDVETLRTLPEREYRSGLAEVLKYALIADAPFFDWLEAHAAAIVARDPAVLERLIARCCALKAQIVAGDEREENGQRALLNFGHTLGHALENILGYGVLLHGEAVAIGMVWALRQSIVHCGLAEDVLTRTEAWLSAMNLPTTMPACDLMRVQQAMQHDKKKLDGQLQLIVLERVGIARIIKVAIPRLDT